MYNAYVIKAKTKPHPNADRLQLLDVHGDIAIIGLNVQDGDFLIYFPSDGQLSQLFAEANQLIAVHDPITGKKIDGGYFDPNLRVRAQSFRGVKSDGFAIEFLAFEKLASYLASQGKLREAADLLSSLSALKVGDSFTHLGGVEICRKYYTPKTYKSGTQKRNKPKKKKNPRFPEHFDTRQFRYEADKIPEDSMLYLSIKLHGTSARYAHVQEEIDIPFPWYRRIFYKLFRRKVFPKTELKWSYLVGTRRVTLKSPDQKNFYDSEQFRFDACKDWIYNLHKGEIIFGELVGYTTTNKPIMPSQSTEKADKKTKKKYGPFMEYKYGCPEGTCKFYVYRIVFVNENGHQIDLPWLQVCSRAEELGLQTVPCLRGPIFYKKEMLPSLEEEINCLIEGPDLLDPSHIREGIVIRIEHSKGVYFLKSKSWLFRYLEGIIKDDVDYIDIEEAESVDHS